MKNYFQLIDGIYPDVNAHSNKRTIIDTLSTNYFHEGTVSRYHSSRMNHRSRPIKLKHGHQPTT